MYNNMRFCLVQTRCALVWAWKRGTDLGFLNKRFRQFGVTRKHAAGFLTAQRTEAWTGDEVESLSIENSITWTEKKGQTLFLWQGPSD